ncbi:unnamed protein product, partial [Amoebophrya sp. A120]
QDPLLLRVVYPPVPVPFHIQLPQCRNSQNDQNLRPPRSPLLRVAVDFRRDSHSVLFRATSRWGGAILRFGTSDGIRTEKRSTG